MNLVVCESKKAHILYKSPAPVKNGVNGTIFPPPGVPKQIQGACVKSYRALL